MVWEITEALFAVALPLGIFGYLLVSWSLKSGRLSGAGDKAQLKTEMRAMKKARKSKEAKSKNPVHNKWLKFGGGFYGAVGLYTFLIIEIREIVSFISGYESVEATFSNLGNSSFFDMIVSFFVNSLINFITAVAWPGFWAPNLSGKNILLWLGIGYAGYWLGMKLAKKKTPKPIAKNEPN